MKQSDANTSKVNGPIILVGLGMFVLCVAMASCVLSVWVR